MNNASSSDTLGQGMQKPINERVLEAYSSGKKRQKSQRFFPPQQILSKKKTHIQVIDQYYSGLNRQDELMGAIYLNEFNRVFGYIKVLWRTL